MKQYIVVIFLIVQLLCGVVLLGDNVKYKSRSQNAERQLEALRRTTGAGVDNAYVCFGAGAKRQLAALLED